MPSVQRGSLFLRNGAWSVRYYDDDGLRRRQGGFGEGRDGKRAAGEWLNAKVREVEARRRGDVAALAPITELTVSEAVKRYLAQHDVDPLTTVKLTSQLRQAEKAFGDRPLRTLAPDELAAWRKTLAEGPRHYVFRAFKQVLAQAERWHWLDESPARHVKNPKPKAPEIHPLESWEQIDAIAGELDPRFAAIPVFAAGTGLRPQEWLALERRDVDRAAGVVTVERVYVQGRLKQCAKTSLQRRSVPLRQRVLDALDAVPTRLDSPLLFPAARGGYIELGNWRADEWKPALRSAGIAHHPIKDLRHTYATWSLAAGVNLFTLSRRMGTSLAMIDQTYGHLAPDAAEQERALLDNYDAAAAAEGR